MLFRSELSAALVAALQQRYASRPALRVVGALAARSVAEGRVALVATRGRTVLYFDRVPTALAAETLRSLLAGR